MRGVLRVGLVCAGGYTGSLGVALVLSFIGMAVAGRGSVTRAEQVMMTVVWLVLMVFALSLVLVGVVAARSMAGMAGRVMVVGAYILVVVPTLLVVATTEAVLFNR